MRWLFLINNAPFLIEFLSKITKQLIEEGQECIMVINSKMAEYEKSKFFPAQAKILSKVDWCIENYNKQKRDFGGLTWREFFPIYDRFSLLNFNYNSSLEAINQVYQFLDYIFEKEKPEVVVGELPVGLFHQIAYYFCKKYQKPFLGFLDSRINNRLDVYDLEWTCSKYEKTFKELKETDITEKEQKFARNFVRKFISHKEEPVYMDLIKSNFGQWDIFRNYIEKTKEFGRPTIKYLLNRNRFKTYDYESEQLLRSRLGAFFRIERREFRILFQKNVFDYSPKDNNYFFYPLQYVPEASTNVLATYYSNQLSSIKNISFTLPLPYKLYIKEHPASIGLRPRDFYQKLKKIPNVVLRSSSENTEQLIKNSSGVIVLTSTVGMEAALSGKPVYILGNVFYYYHPFCRKVENFEDLRKQIKKDQVSKPDIRNLEKINCRFITSYLRNTIEGNILDASYEKDNNDYRKICANLRALFLTNKN